MCASGGIQRRQVINESIKKSNIGHIMVIQAFASLFLIAYKYIVTNRMTN